MTHTVRTILDLRNVIESKKQEMLDEGARYIQKRLKENYESGVPEGVPMKKHSGLTEDMRGRHQLFKVTGKGIDSIDIATLPDDKRKIFTEYYPFIVSEKGSSHIVSKKEAGWFWANHGIRIKVGTVITQPKRPVFEVTANSVFMKKGLIRAMESAK